MNKEASSTITPHQEILIKTLTDAIGFCKAATSDPKLPVFDSEWFLLFQADSTVRDDTSKTIRVIDIMNGIAVGCWRELKAEGLQSVAQEIIDKNKI